MRPSLLLRISAELHDYYSQWLLIADSDPDGSLVLIAKPFIDFEAFTCYLCETVLDTVPLQKGLEIKLYKFGRNEHVFIQFL